MDPQGYLYVPDNCYKDQCYIHVALHGCSQSRSFLGQEYVENTGYLEWAAQNNMIVLFPQAIKTELNANGCWDFWGYSGKDYATKDGEQPQTIMRMVEQL